MNNIKTLMYGGFTFTALSGIFLHFAFDLSDGMPVIGAVTPVNESVWEHLKLLYLPVAIYTVMGMFYHGKCFKNFTTGCLLGLIVGMFFIVIAYYGYTAITGEDYAIADIAIFFTADLLVFLVMGALLKSGRLEAPLLQGLSLLAFFILLSFFATFTFMPPHCPLFLDPISSTYGISML